jgi:hypothetical protein
MTRRELNADFEEFLACLNRHHVDYLIVGSEAVAVYGAPRFSADFDTFVAPIAENLQRALKAIGEFGFTEATRAIDVNGWIADKRTLEMGREPNQVHVLIDLSGVTYDEAAADAHSGVYGETPVRFIGYEALLKNKRAAGRPKDLADVAALTRAGGRRDSD